ncbi:MAG: sigma 54-interacting transcriptional regulator [Planctomycetota bacterium]
MGRILVIEDEPGTQLLLQSRLHDLGHEVVTAPTGANGLMEARSETFDLFIVDLNLGSGIDGYEVCRRLKAMPHTHGVPVVLVSAQMKGREELHRGYEAGCESYLIKGDMTLLEDVVRAMLRIKSLQDDLSMQNRLLDEHNRRLQEERRRGADLESALRDQPAGVGALKDLALGRAEALLLVDAEGVVTLVDRGARELFGKEVEGKSLGKLAVGTGLEAFCRDARTEPREGFRLDLALPGSPERRRLTANVIPLVPRPGHADRGFKIVLLSDATRRKVAAEMLRIEEKGTPRRELGPLLEAARHAFHPSSLLGISPQMGELRAELMRLATLDTPVVLVGEPGSGRQRAARALHFGENRSGPFVPVSCGALDADSLRAELIGYVKGAFPEALADSPGLIEQAHRGTLFLDDVTAIPLEVQALLVDFLERGEVTRLGGKRAEKPKVRVVAAAGYELDRALEDGSLNREFHRLLSVHSVHVVPLRERLVDVRPLAQYYLGRFGSHLGNPELSDEALWVLENYNWPGNVRELKSAMERACSKATDAVIGLEDLPQSLRDLQSKLMDQAKLPVTHRRMPSMGGGQMPRSFSFGQTAAGVFGRDDDEEISLEYYEKLALLRALDETGGDKLKAAGLLKIGKSTLYRKLKRYGIK